MQDEDFGVQVSPSSVLQNLLQQYPSGGQFISEALQNAEDTDRATRFCAVLDLQHHPTEHIRKDYSWRARLQGPAILFYDNGGFEERDWKSLQSFYKSEKKHSPSEVGKYGMGSRSFFHIGDVIQIVSGTKFAELDPDERVSSNGRYGARIDFESELFGGKKFSEAYPDECAPFNFFGCTMDTPFDGTIIRVPLRQKSWASESSFMPEEFGPERAQQVFKEFVKVMRRGDVAMFLPRLRCLEIFVCKEHHEMQRLASIEVEQPEPQEPQRREELGHSLLDVKQFLKQFDTTKHLQDELKKSLSTAPTVHEHIIFKSRSGPEEAQEAQEAHWLRFGRFFDCHALDLPGEVPFVCVAMPLGGAATGLAFAHLPLPIKTGLPVHVHAGFALQDNRRGIWRQAEDTDGIHKTWASWNEYIIKEAICQIYADALKLQLENAKSKSASDMFSHLWPRLELKKEAFQEVLAGLVHILRSEAVLRTAFGDRVKPNDAQLLDLPTDALKTWHDELEKLCLEAGMKIVNPPEHIAQLLRHYEAINIKDCVIAINEALLPRHDVSPQLRLRILLALLHWAGSTFNPEQLEDLRTMLKDLEWIPLADGYGAVSATFDPDAKLPPLHVVTRHLPDLSKWIEEQFTKDQAKYVWQALRSCGMKKEITWEDALEEAEHISHSGDHNLSKILFKHLGQNYSAMHGKKEECMDKLKGLKWVLAHPHQDAASKSPHTSRGTVLRSLSEIFPVSEFDFVWAVESTLHTELDVPVPAFLKASRSVKSEPTVLVSQLEACARAAPGPDDTPTEQPPRTGLVPPEKLSDFTIPMKELYENHKESAARLLKPLRDLAFLPCMPKSEGGAILFQLEHAALESDQGHQKLLPVFGIVHSDVRELAVQIGVEKRPGVSSLVDCIPRFGAEMAVVLCTELAGRLEKYKDDALLYKAVLANLQVPTATGQFLPSREVYVNDAPWTRSGPVETLDERISHVHGRRLGCTSVRNKLAQECEDGSDEEDAFGQEADLVDQVELILKDYSSPSDVVAEFFQNTDDFGASHLVFALSDTTYDGKKVVDQRCEALQGPALYICSSKPLEEEDLKKMQKVGGSAKSHDFQSTGRFGIGMNVMYRYSDCPQLLANGRLHFFDLQKRFVARKKGKRGRKFRIEELQEFFPDSVAPFKDFMHLYPVIFRLPLRTKQSRLGESVNLSSVQSDLQCAQKQAPSMLLFSKSVRRISFSGPSDFTASHEAVMDEAQEQKHKEFFASLPKTLAELDHGEDRQLCVKKRIVSQLGSKDHGREWVVAHTLALSSKSLLNICAALFAEPLGDALLPLAAAAAPLDDKDSQGRICCGLPTPLKTGGRSWINGSFVLSSSRKQILLPENVDSNREKDWNQKLLKGPAASSLKAVMLECRKVVGSEENVEAFFDLLPSGMNTQIEEVLVVATMSSAMKDQLFPVLSANGAGSVKVNWIYGPKPLLRTKRLSQELQNLLASDGLQLVFLPSGAKDVYEKALQHEPRHLDNEELCKFLAETWASLQPNIFKHVALEDVGVQVLSDAKAILQLLNFIAVKADPQFKQLEGVPLFLTHGGKLSAFGRENVCFKSDRELLPNHPDLFVHNEVWQEITGVKGHPEPVGVRKLKTEDLLPFKSEVEALVIEGGRMFGQNAYLRHLWRFISKKENVAQSIKQMQAWQFLPVHSNDGEALVLLNLASQTVDPLAMRLDQKVQQALLCAGLLLLQDGVLDLSGNERLLLEAGIVQKDHDLVSLLLEVDRNTFDTLNLDQRYALLAYFSGLVVREIMHHLPEDISRLPLFKLAQGEGFTDVCEMNVTFCCLDKKDKHAGALEKLMPLKAVLLAWPTMQVRPIYEFLGIQCHSGEDFMVRFILPDLERLCREHTSGTPCTLPKQYFQLLDQLQEFVSEGSSKVIEAAMDKQIFLSASGSPSTASSLVDPNILLIRCFKQCCSEYLPAEGVDQYPELLAGLGLQMFVPEDLLLKLAQQLDAKKDWKVTDELREQSFYLVEAVANTLSRESKDALNATALNAISKLHIVVAAQIEESQAKEEIEAMQGQRGFFHVNACVAKTSLTSLKLRPFRGTAFGESRNLLWSTSFVAYHRHPQVGTAPQLERALKYYTEEMYRNFGAFVTSDHVPFKLLSEHMMNLCSLPHPEKEELTVDKTSTFCEQLMSCFDELRKRNLTTAQHRELRAFNQNGMRCIAVKQDDAANIPEQSQITFASPRRCFTFRNFKAKAFHGYLREAQGLKLYSDMGVADDPDALTLAALTQRVKDEYPDDYSNGRIMRDVDVLQACLKCFHSLVKGSEIERSRLSERLPFNFYYLDEDDKIEDVSALVSCL